MVVRTLSNVFAPYRSKQNRIEQSRAEQSRGKKMRLYENEEDGIDEGKEDDMR